jgi:putative ABC transport system substrate-binding protein
MKRKTLVWLLAISLLATIPLAQAQEPAKVPRIGYVGPATTDPRTASFRQGLRDLGYMEEKNILVEYRYVGGRLDRFADVVAELVQLKVEVLVAVPFQAILAAKQATKTIPIVMVTTLDPVATASTAWRDRAETSRGSPDLPEYWVRNGWS